METPNGDTDLLTDRPLQLPKVGWDDDEDTSNFTPSQDPPEAPVPLPKKHSRHSSSRGNHRSLGISQRSNRLSDLELQPIPEDFSMHGPWPDFCIYDYDVDRRKTYRYRMCGRLTFRGFILVVLGCMLFVGLVIRLKSSTSTDDSHSSSGISSSNNSNIPEPPKLTQQQTQLYELIATSFHPLWYDRSRGWNGTAYLQSYEFCNAQGEGRVPCPYVAYCPLGPGYAPSGGRREEGEGWAPVSDGENSWGEFK